jgi:hypothetical protein
MITGLLLGIVPYYGFLVPTHARLAIRAHIRKEISNKELKEELHHRYCSKEENNDLDKWFPDENNKETVHAEGECKLPLEV